MSAAANDLLSKTEKKINELIGLEPAFGIKYDIDARNGFGDSDTPIPFTNDIAMKSRTYTVTDLFVEGKFAGDNAIAALAERSYLVQYDKTDFEYNLINAPEVLTAVNTAYHNSVISIFADLVEKKIEEPDIPWNTLDQFDKYGKLAFGGPFDGVIVAPQPWITDPKEPLSSKAIGWANGFTGINIYGSEYDDIMYRDRFDKDSISSSGTTIDARGGNDILIGDDPSDYKGVDQLYGGDGEDTIVFGYRRYGQSLDPYKDRKPLDPLDLLFGKGLDSYAVLKDFNPEQDRLKFNYSRQQISYKDISEIDGGPGSSGIGILADYRNNSILGRFDDLIAYIPGITSQQMKDVFDTRTTFNTSTNLDADLFWS